MEPATQMMETVKRYARFIGAAAFLMLAQSDVAPAQEPPAGLVRDVASNEARTEEARSRYLYKQTVLIEEAGGQKADGVYREVREVIFSPEGERTDRLQGPSISRLKRLILTREDFEDIRNIQPILITPETLPRYRVVFKGEEIVDGVDCWVLEIRPRQTFQGFRMFDGMAWVEKAGRQIIRTYGQAVPPIYSNGQENLFPRFTTIREKVDGAHWFPVLTHADDTLPFSSGPLRIRMRIEYKDYKRFGAESTITFQEKQP